MDHGSTSGNETASCTHNMSWNWDTIGACFFSDTWRIQTEGAFAASCIGVFLLVICLEVLRRVSKEYDGFILRQFQQHVAARAQVSRLEGSGAQQQAVVTYRASPLQQLIRAVLHAASFGVAYVLMLIAMAFNGYIIISIIIGAGVGKFLCDWMVVKVVVGGGSGDGSGKASAASLEEPTLCCG
ncbi:Ctr-domain-containing protein [Durotheca rogersii]|uniref:Ctr-domain-containing protein n=1 Tax=Durotheca rogersii TaxID=419775 RepID=UPI0022210559|nr:Ctr-domain-containing protein [Durotheca rogersii]KAI5865296.1 Ctr-domain-containing protein [Durotheca rogersii]